MKKRKGRKRKKGSTKLGIIILIVLFLIAAAKQVSQNKEGVHVLQPVKESDIRNLVDMEEKDEQVKEHPDIRVLIMGTGYRGEVHPEVVLSSTGKMCLMTESGEEYIEAGKKLILNPNDDRFDCDNIKISSKKKIKIEHLDRAYGTPSYEGIIELRKTAEGIVIINELSVEKYLKAVVPSEMPSSYEMEALKAQAVCARSYAYRQMGNYAYPEYKAHVNDSTDYQVYGNSKPQKSTNQAIKETEGQAVYYQGKIATTYYYSTSSGKTTDVRAWGTKKSEKNSYLQSVNVAGKSGDYEKKLPWYRWRAEIPADTLSNLIGLNTGKDIGKLKNIKVTKRGGGNVALEIKASGENGSVTVKTENKIRSALGGNGYTITLQDGTVTDSKDLLPSAFFAISKSADTFVIEGGGFGHGIGMSQNGANEMAKQGKDYVEILKLFYKNIDVR